jgi:signal transduction histidine kinase
MERSGGESALRLHHAAVNTEPSADQAALLRGTALIIARVMWALTAVVALGMSVVNIRATMQLWTPPFTSAPPALWTPEELVSALHQLGLPPSFPGAFVVIHDLLFLSTYFVVAAVLLWYKSAERMALLASLFLLLFPAGWLGVREAFPDAWALLREGVSILAILLLLYFFLLFPDGRFIPRWTKPLGFGLPALQVLIQVLSEIGVTAGFWLPLVLGGFVCCASAQVYRYRCAASPHQRQQIKWMAFSFTTGVVGLLSYELLLMVFPWLRKPGTGTGLLFELFEFTVVIFMFLLIPISIALAIFRHRLWDIDIIISRSLVYGALTASGVGIYALVVGGLGALVQPQGNFLVSALATGIVAVLFLPLRAGFQRVANHLLYGERDDPYTVLSRLGQRLEGAFAPGAVLPTLVETVRDALKLSYVAVALQQEEAVILAAAVGEAVETPLTLPLSYQGELLGHLLLGSRWRDEPFRPADRRLLGDLARQAGVAVYAARLTTDLHQSRERLVVAREEERRRLRRDLHDGLGPALSSQLLTFDAVNRLLDRDPETARALLNELRAQSQTAFLDIRRLIYDLRPPALDDLGLVAALQESLARHRQSGLECVVEVDEPLPALPAAVEVAVYRIAQEALTNVARHAGARTCQVCLALTTSRHQRGVRLEVRDDGCGLPATRPAGVGLRSMRERAEELGGSLVMEGRSGGGTRVSAWLPVPEEEPCA